MQPAFGVGGPVTVLFVVVDASRTAAVERDLDLLAPEGFRTSTRLNSAAWVPLPPDTYMPHSGCTCTRTRSAKARRRTDGVAPE